MQRRRALELERGQARRHLVEAGAELLERGQCLVGLLYGITSYDPMTIAFVMMILGLAATLACLIPTLRALRINPITALRE